MDEWEFYRMQHERAVQVYLQTLTNGLQLTVLVLLADVTVAGYALANRASAVLLVAASLPVAAAYSIRRFTRFGIPFLYIGFLTENRLSPGHIDGVVRTAVGVLGDDMHREFLRIASLQEEDERYRALRSTRRLGKLALRLQQRVLVSIGLVQVVVSILIPLFKGWRFV